jgi:hypothetical protein
VIDFPASPTVGQIFDTPTFSYEWNGTSWIANPPDAGSGSGLPDAPVDGIQYGRQDAAWTEITAGGSGTPVDAYTKTESDAKFVELAGDTMTGALLISDGTLTAPGLAFASETTMGIYRIGAGNIEITGRVGVTEGNFSVGKVGSAPDARLNVVKNGDGQVADVYSQNGTLPRWLARMADESLESGANAGSNFSLMRFADDGTLLGSVLSASRASGIVDFSSTPTVLGVPIGGAGGSPELPLPDGSVTAPSLAFASEVGLGWYRPSANAVNMACGGAQTFRFNATPTVSNLGINPIAAGGGCGLYLNAYLASGAPGPNLAIQQSPTGVIFNENDGAAGYLPISFLANSFSFAGSSGFIIDSPSSLYLNFYKSGSGQAVGIAGGITGGSTRWQMELGNSAPETGLDAGSDFALHRFSDTGTILGTAFSIVRATGAANFASTVNFAAGATGLTAASVGLPSVTNDKQVKAGVGDLTLSWSSPTANLLNLRVDATEFGAEWPINVTGRAAVASNADNATWSANCSGNAATATNATNASFATNAGNADTLDGAHAASFVLTDGAAVLGFETMDISRPYIRHTDQRIQKLAFSPDSTCKDLIFQGINVGVNAYWTGTGDQGYFGIAMNYSDETQKTSIAPSTVNATDVITAMEFIEFTGKVNTDIFYPLGFSAQKLRAQSEHFASAPSTRQYNGEEQYMPMIPNDHYILAYVAKALQETIARLAALEGITP